MDPCNVFFIQRIHNAITKFCHIFYSFTHCKRRQQHRGSVGSRRSTVVTPHIGRTVPNLHIVVTSFFFFSSPLLLAPILHDGKQRQNSIEVAQLALDVNLALDVSCIAFFSILVVAFSVRTLYFPCSSQPHRRLVTSFPRHLLSYLDPSFPAERSPLALAPTMPRFTSQLAQDGKSG